jgi:hypothetical protein
MSKRIISIINILINIIKKTYIQIQRLKATGDDIDAVDAEIKELEKFQTVLNHSKRVLDPADVSLITKLQGEFQKALGIQ